MPRKVFVAGEILTAADVNEFLSDQVVMTFAGTAARGSAIGTAVEGMVTYLEDTDSFEYWDGSAWDELTLPVSTTSPVSGDSLVYNGTNWVNGPRSGNAIINGDFGIWQRGTSFSSVSDTEYTADRWIVDSLSGATADVSRQSFSAGELEVASNIGSEYFFRFDVTGADDNARFGQYVEDVRTFAGQEVTLSFWAKSANAPTGLFVRLQTDFGSGGSTIESPSSSNTFSIGSSWQRFSFTTTLPSLTGKTIGSDSHLNVLFWNDANETWTLDVWGVQLEAGPVATPFKLAGGGSKAAELALCQRYYQKITTDNATDSYAHGFCDSTTAVFFNIPFVQSMRTAPTALETTGTAGDYRIRDAGANRTPTGVPSFQAATDNTMRVLVSTTGLTAGRAVGVWANAAGYLAWSAEL